MLVEHQPHLRSLGVRRIGLFGSYAREVATLNSDIDFLATIDEPSFDRYMEVRFFLEDLLGRRVDLVLEEDVKPRLLPHILAEVIYAS